MASTTSGIAAGKDSSETSEANYPRILTTEAALYSSL